MNQPKDGMDYIDRNAIDVVVQKAARDAESVGKDKDRPCKHSKFKICNCIGNQTCPHYPRFNQHGNDPGDLDI